MLCAILLVCLYVLLTFHYTIVIILLCFRLVVVVIAALLCFFVCNTTFHSTTPDCRSDILAMTCLSHGLQMFSSRCAVSCVLICAWFTFIFRFCLWLMGCLHVRLVQIHYSYVLSVLNSNSDLSIQIHISRMRIHMLHQFAFRFMFGVRLLIHV